MSAFPVLLGVSASFSSSPAASWPTKSYMLSQDDPWMRAGAKYRVGTRVQARVGAISTTGFGIFVALEPSVDALVHVSDLPAGKKPTDYKVGQTVEVLILTVDTTKRRISASLKPR